MDLANMPIDISNFPEIEENRYHPMNDRFNQEISHVQKIIMAHQRSMKPKHVKVAKMRFAGHTNVDIAEATGYSEGTVSRIAQRNDVDRLLSLLNYIDSAMAGPSTSHRIAVLHRIVVDNEIKNPKVAIQAIAEINKMAVNQHNMDSETVPGQTTIVINQNHFPKTPLDG